MKDNNQPQALQITHYEEIQRIKLSYAEKLRESEIQRINAESRVEEIEELLAEKEDDFRLRQADLTERFHTVEQALEQAQKDALRYRKAMVDAELRVEAIKQSFSYQLGFALVQATKSWKGLIALPGEIVALLRDTRARHSGGIRSKSTETESRALMCELSERFAKKGLEDTEVWLRERFGPDKSKELASGLTQLAKLARNTRLLEACRLSREALKLDPRPFRRKWLTFLLFEAGTITEAHELLLSLARGERLSASERFKAERIRGSFRLLKYPPQLPAREVKTDYHPIAGRIMYVAASSLPHHVSGYTLRTHAILRELRAQGRDVHCITRPGYPWDRSDTGPLDTLKTKTVDGITYESLSGPHRRKISPDRYIAEAATIIESHARKIRPAIIHAASNHENALPALIAARRLGIPFIYEVRGLWEYTSATKKQNWDKTEAFDLDRRLETLVATNADLVFTLTKALAGELVKRGVDTARILQAPNAVNPAEFTGQSRDNDLAVNLGLCKTHFVAGYIGSVVSYEGLDDLITAVAQIRPDAAKVRLLIVGDGDAMPALRRLTTSLGVNDITIFTGKVPPTEVRRYYSLLNALVLPRKPETVCQLVSPLKPLEAMAAGVPLLVSDAAALKEMVRVGETALVHEAGNSSSLAEELLRLIRDPSLCKRLADTARLDVQTQRNWQVVCRDIASQYDRLAR